VPHLMYVASPEASVPARIEPTPVLGHAILVSLFLC
jgi:hypothetical protein